MKANPATRGHPGPRALARRADGPVDPGRPVRLHGRGQPPPVHRRPEPDARAHGDPSACAWRPSRRASRSSPRRPASTRVLTSTGVFAGTAEDDVGGLHRPDVPRALRQRHPADVHLPAARPSPRRAQPGAELRPAALRRHAAPGVHRGQEPDGDGRDPRPVEARRAPVRHPGRHERPAPSRPCSRATGRTCSSCGAPRACGTATRSSRSPSPRGACRSGCPPPPASRSATRSRAQGCSPVGLDAAHVARRRSRRRPVGPAGPHRLSGGGRAVGSRGLAAVVVIPVRAFAPVLTALQLADPAAPPPPRCAR